MLCYAMVHYGTYAIFGNCLRGLCLRGLFIFGFWSILWSISRAVTCLTSPSCCHSPATQHCTTLGHFGKGSPLLAHATMNAHGPYDFQYETAMTHFYNFGMFPLF